MFKNQSFRYTLLQIIIGTSAIRCFLAFQLNLGNDEVYYFTYAVQPDWNHFDHPPLVGLFIRFFTANLHWLNDFSLRLPAIIIAAVNTWLIATCGQNLKNKQAGLIAAILYNTSIYTSIISGLFILPDSVQVLFWLVALSKMLQVIDYKPGALRNKNILLLGFWIGVTILCKVHGIFLWIGFFGFMATCRPNWFKNPFVYLSVFITAFIITPIILWNISNDFICWQFHSNRVELNRGPNLISFFRTTLGQIAYNNPFNVIIGILALTALRKPEKYIGLPKLSLLLWCSLPIIAATTLISLFRDTLPHWSGPGFTAVILLSAAYMAGENNAARSANHTRLLRTAVGFTLLIIALGLGTIKFYPGTPGDKKAQNLGSGDPTLDMYGWEELLPAFQKIRNRDIKNGTMRKDAPLVVHKWFPGSHLYYYVAYPLQMKTVGLGQINDLHKFAWLNDRYGGIAPGSDAYYISPSNVYTDPSKIYRNQFQSFEQAGIIPSFRNGKPARYWYVYRMKNALGTGSR